MSQYQMNINGRIELADYSSIYDYMSIVNKDDNLTITIDNNGLDNINIIKRILEDNRFTIDLGEQNNNGRYYIKAFKVK
ncbi:hypothetical protein [Clostridium sp. DJ247]|uniref:hypothetical protein n=1 Tax=Clostridium sp. DJ247 TaxID=2726188 RepID=UPI00162599AF|nr:hypothetical protein [Clostridium sp. DJ247]MBC2582540.1 hypothetical protein [Clostridium sp. DJ247]